MTSADEARLTEIGGHGERQARLVAQHGMPEHISNADALALAATALVPVEPGVTADDWIFASIYRDAAAADAWLESNLEHYGHPALARVPLPDGRVVGILDLRPRCDVPAGMRRLSGERLASGLALPAARADAGSAHH